MVLLSSVCLATQFFSGSPHPRQAAPQRGGGDAERQGKGRKPLFAGHQYLEGNSSADGHPQIC